MTEGSMAIGLLLLQQRADVRLMGSLAAEPWKEKPRPQSAEARRKAGFLVRLNRVFEPQQAPGPCCCET